MSNHNTSTKGTAPNDSPTMRDDDSLLPPPPEYSACSSWVPIEGHALQDLTSTQAAEGRPVRVFAYDPEAQHGEDCSTRRAHRDSSCQSKSSLRRALETCQLCLLVGCGASAVGALLYVLIKSNMDIAKHKNSTTGEASSAASAAALEPSNTQTAYKTSVSLPT